METDYWQKPIGSFVVAMEGIGMWLNESIRGKLYSYLSSPHSHWLREGWQSHHSTLTFLWFELISAIQLHLPLPLVGQVYQLTNEIKQIERGDPRSLLHGIFWQAQLPPQRCDSDLSQVQRVIRWFVVSKDYIVWFSASLHAMTVNGMSKQVAVTNTTLHENRCERNIHPSQ